MLHLHTFYVSNLELLDQKEWTELLQKFKKLKIIHENLKEAIVENSATRVGFGRKKFDKLTFDFYTHGTYI